MINFFSENRFLLTNEAIVSDWICKVVAFYGGKIEEINYIFCDDRYLLKINRSFLAHDYYTDIITFDESAGKNIAGEIYISTERVADNARTFKTCFDNELNRVIIHGVLHLLGFKDKTEEEKRNMRQRENDALEMFES